MELPLLPLPDEQTTRLHPVSRFATLAPPELDAPPLPADCPRCASKLIDPAGLGWCKDCGYCRSLEEERARVPTTAPPRPPQMSALGLVEFAGLLAKLPTWVWTLLGGIAVAVAFSVPPNYLLEEGGLERCLWCTAQIVIGVGMLFAAQFWAVMTLAYDDERLSFKDAVIGSRLWLLTIKKLPATQRQVFLGAWGLTLIVSAVLLIGGLSHWFTYLPRSSPPAPNPPPAAEAQP